MKKEINCVKKYMIKNYALKKQYMKYNNSTKYVTEKYAINILINYDLNNN